MRLTGMTSVLRRRKKTASGAAHLADVRVAPTSRPSVLAYAQSGDHWAPSDQISGAKRVRTSGMSSLALS